MEDQWENSQFLLALLTSLGFEVRQAADGQAGVEVWETWQPHLILMDMRMPGMDGYEVTRQIRAQESLIMGQSEPFPNDKPPMTKIIALTASVFKETQSAVLAAGCDDILHKPVQIDLLLEKLAEHLEVNYLYEAKHPLPASAHPANLAASSQSLQAQLHQMPIDWVQQLHRAALKGSDDTILQLSQRIPSEYLALKDALAEWSHNFWFNKITDLIENHASECQFCSN